MVYASPEIARSIIIWIRITTTVNHVISHVNHAQGQAVLSVKNATKDFISLDLTFQEDAYQFVM
jgi:hypothetical protein